MDNFPIGQKRPSGLWHFAPLGPVLGQGLRACRLFMHPRRRWAMMVSILRASSMCEMLPSCRLGPCAAL
jgi:hypothetical protein